MARYTVSPEVKRFLPELEPILQDYEWFNDWDQDEVRSDMAHYCRKVRRVTARPNEYGCTKSNGDSCFPQFTRLAPQLRGRIWRLYCPELA